MKFNQHSIPRITHASINVHIYIICIYTPIFFSFLFIISLISLKFGSKMDLYLSQLLPS